jgi:hypothetical protein
MEKQPKFIKDFSKEGSQVMRDQVARLIKRKRSTYFENKNVQTDRYKELLESMDVTELALENELTSLKNLEYEINEISAKTLGKIRHYFKIKKLRADSVLGKKTYSELQQQQDTQTEEAVFITEKLNSDELPEEFSDAKTMLDNFYKEQKDNWADSEYTNEDVKKFFSEEHLSSLSVEDYALLLKRFPGEMVAHVTRQGIRDHTGHMYHTAGEGDYSNSFMKMLHDGRLRSPLGVRLTENNKEQAISELLNLDLFNSKQDALDYLKTFLGAGGIYVDAMAIHFATEEVADCFYGSEKGNEIFIVYPSAYIASQYYFSGQLNEKGGGYWNDQWVWANEERGMDLDAGLVFVPEEAMVDKKTGSRYELDENRKPIKNIEYRDAFKSVIDSTDFHDFAKQVMQVYEEVGKVWDRFGLMSEDQEKQFKLEPFRQKLEHEFSISDRRLQTAVLDYHNLFSLIYLKKDQEGGKEGVSLMIESKIEAAMQDLGILYAEAKDPINSKEYWETYFSKNPTQKPSKVVYYKGSDPTRALHEWRDSNKIYNKSDDKFIGFPERSVERDSPEAMAGSDRFISIATKIINEHFVNRPAS